MKKKFFLIAMMLLSLSAIMSAMSPIKLRINGVTLYCDGDQTKLDKSMNEQFLKGVYCGSTIDLNDEEIFITQFKQSDNYVIAVLKAYKDYCVATYKPDGGIIDGALLLKNEDILAACDFTNPNGNEMVAFSPEISLEENKISVTRQYLTYVNVHNCGVETTERGYLTMEYDVDKSGMISKSGVKQHAVWNEEIPGGRKKSTVESEQCQTLGEGMEVIQFCTNPVSKENKDTPKQLETLLNKYYGMINDFNSYITNEGFLTVSTCLRQLENQLEGMIFRNPDLWLSWLDKNQKSKCMKTLKESLKDDEDLKSNLQDVVKSLMDKKLRKAWEKRLK